MKPIDARKLACSTTSLSAKLACAGNDGGEHDAVCDLVTRAVEEALVGQDRTVVVALADQLADAQAAVRAANESLSRLTTIVDEAFGMQPVMSTENLLTFLERSLYERRVATEDAQRNAAQAVARVRELEGAVDEALALLAWNPPRTSLEPWKRIFATCSDPTGDRCGNGDAIGPCWEHTKRAIVDRLTASAAGSKATNERAMAEALIKESAAAIRDLFADPEVDRILSHDDWAKSLKKTLGGLEEWLTASAVYANAGTQGGEAGL